MVSRILICLIVLIGWGAHAETPSPSPLQKKFEKKKSDSARLYAHFGYKPIWLEGGDWNDRAKNLLKAIQNSGKEGLNPKQYSKLNDLMVMDLQGEDVQIKVDVEVTKVFLHFTKDLLLGRLSYLNKQGRKLGKHDAFDLAQSLIEQFKNDPDGDFIPHLTVNLEGYQRLKKLLAQYKSMSQAETTWPAFPKGETLKVVEKKHGKQTYPTDNRVIALRKILTVQGDLQGGDPNSPLYDQGVVEAVKGFQKRHVIKVDGVVGPETTAMLNLSHKGKVEKILLAMERWRWMPKKMEDRFVIVNIPGFHLTAYEQGKEKFDMNIIVGRRYRKTPTFSSEIYSVRFNPSWHIPPGIFRKDKLPKILRDPSYVNRKGYIVYDRYSGQRLNPHHVNWGAEDVKLVQPPGNRNALGKIRFTLKTTNSVYLHGTPDQHLFKKHKRSFSSGCIRVEDPQKLAVYMFNDETNWSLEKIERESSHRRTKNIPLKTPVPVHIVYLTAWVDDQGDAYFAHDIYGRDRVLVEQIRQIHYDNYTALVDIEELFREEEEEEETLLADMETDPIERRYNRTHLAEGISPSQRIHQPVLRRYQTPTGNYGLY